MSARSRSQRCGQRIARVVVLLQLIAAVIACGSKPIPLVVVRGTTFTIAVGRDQNVGYQSLITRNEGIYDDQRGELIFFLHPLGGNETDPNAPGNVRLTTRLVFRFQPDPATQGGIENDVGPDQLVELNEVLALIDVPATAGTGLWKLGVARVRGHNPLNPVETGLPAPALGTGTDHPTIWIVADTSGGNAAPTPTTGYDAPNFTDAQFYLAREAVPHPKLVVSFTAAVLPRAGHLVLTFPTAKLLIKDVHEHNNLGRHSFVLWKEAPPGTLTVDWASQEPLTVSNPVRELAVAFALKTTTPVLVTDFQLSSPTFYDDNGSAIANPTVTLVGIR